MADPAIVAEWLAKADEDFHFAASNLAEGSDYHAQICFHFQQAAEKYLKAFILSYNLPFEKVHDLVHLLRVCTKAVAAFGELKEECILLNTAYIETRYPVHWPTAYSNETSLSTQAATVRIAKLVKEQIEANNC